MNIRQQLHAYIDELSESKLEALRPLLSVLADEVIVVETDLTAEECDMIAQGMAAYAENPDAFTPLDQMK